LEAKQLDGITTLADKNINVSAEHIPLHFVFNDGRQSMETFSHVCIAAIKQVTTFIGDMNHGFNKDSK